MKFNIIIIKKKNLIAVITAIIILCAFLIGAMIIKKHSASVETFNVVSPESYSFQEDFNGDGRDDILTASSDSGKYELSVDIGNRSIPIKSGNDKIPLGSYSSIWPMKIGFMDADRDRLPEIFIQSSEDSFPIQHIFHLDESGYNDILCSNSNILGFLDCSSGKTPKIVSGTYKNGTLDLGFYIISNKKIKNYSYAFDSLPGAAIIRSFIAYMESLPYDESNTPDIFYSGLSGNVLYPIGKISAESSSVKFLDGSFADTKSNKSGSTSELTWSLRFKNTPKSASLSSKSYKLKVTLNEDPSHKYSLRISSITLQN